MTDAHGELRAQLAAELQLPETSPLLLARLRSATVAQPAREPANGERRTDDVWGATEDESHLAFTDLEDGNLFRLYSFIRDVLAASLETDTTRLTEPLIKAFNAHAIAGLHESAGTYRTVPLICDAFAPPNEAAVPLLMSQFVAMLPALTACLDPVSLATLVYWRVCYIQPFRDGNKRTAAACAYFVLCCQLGGKLPGARQLPDRMGDNTLAFIKAFDQALASFDRDEPLNLSKLHELIAKLVSEQLASAGK